LADGRAGAARGLAQAHAPAQRLGKPGVYRLNEAAASPQAGDTARAIDRCSGAARVALLLAAGCTLALEAMR